MVLHLIKLSVGVDDVAHLRRLQAGRLQREGRLVHVTRNTPRKAADLLDGGSIYWVIRGVIQARQRLLGFEDRSDDGKPACGLVLDPNLIEVAPRRHRAFQGWRYLAPGDAPPDQGSHGVGDDLPAGMRAELRELGLL